MVPVLTGVIPGQGLVTDALEDQYSDKFLQIVGKKLVQNIPIVDARELNINRVARTIREIVTPDLLKQQMVRGANKAFIAAKVDLFQKGQLVTQVVEIVEVVDVRGTFQTAYVNKGANGRLYPSGIYGLNEPRDQQPRRVNQHLVYMTDSDLGLFAKLLKGEEIPHKSLPDFTMKLAK